MIEQSRPALVSVIIPSYNRGDLIGQTLASVLAQTYPHVEIIVADDGSTDDTFAAVARFGDRVRLLPLPHTGLPAAARNAAIAEARGEYLAFCDSDDLWYPEKLACQVAALEADSAAGLACTDALLWHEGEDEPHDRLLRPGQAVSGQVLERLLRENFIINSSVLIRREVLEASGLLCEEQQVRGIEDYDLWLRIAAVTGIAYLDEPLVVYRSSPTSLSAVVPTIDNWRGRLYLLERAGAFLDEHALLTPDLRRALNHATADLLLGLARACRHAGDREGALRVWWRLLRVRPRTAVKQASLYLLRRLAARQAPSPLRRPEITGGLRLHLGCGEKQLDGYLNIDYPPSEHTVQRHSAADLHADITMLQYPPDSVDEVRLHHVFEHFDRPTALRLLMTWYEWLRDGGLLTIETPDFTRCAREALRRKRPEKQQAILRHLFGSHEAGWAVHADGWYMEKFALVLTALGFSELTFTSTAWRDTFNITVQAVKRPPVHSREEQLQACERLLNLSLVDDSALEQRMLACWIERLRPAGNGESGP